MITVLVHENGSTREASAVEPAWLAQGSGVLLWVDIAAPTPEDGKLLRELFGFHELAVEDALSALHHPKVESYGSYLYVILHGIAFRQTEHNFATHDIDFFLGRSFLVTVHDGTSRSIPQVRGLCGRSAHILEEGPLALAHRIVDTMIKHYEPEMNALRDQIDAIEHEIFVRPTPELMRSILALKRDVGSLRQDHGARRGRSAGAPRVRDDRRGHRLSLPRRLRPAGAPDRRGGALPRPHLEPARRAPG